MITNNYVRGAISGLGLVNIWFALAELSGVLVRRVVCRVRPGDAVNAGQRFGVMKFGSRIDLFLPLAARLLVSEGARVRAGETVIARWS